jgi:hypothetical protein
LPSMHGGSIRGPATKNFKLGRLGVPQHSTADAKPINV